MAKCEHCGRKFHYCTSCGCDGYSEYDLCSAGCRQQYELGLSESMTLDDALRIAQEMVDDMDNTMPNESAALRKLLSCYQGTIAADHFDDGTVIATPAPPAKEE